jgi:hypothetical protein
MKDPQIEWLLDQMEMKNEQESFSHYDAYLKRIKSQEKEVWIPTDEEIENWASYDSQSELERLGMIRGAKWIKRILTKNK